ncbi:MAG: endonuclease/exonuclease/phosphatase family protein [Desulfobacteraceae bacterium]
MLFFAVTVLNAQLACGDCRGCCSRRGGLVCVNGVTRCVDRSALTQTCLQKNCNVCPEDQADLGTTAPPSATNSIASFNIQVFGRTKAGKVEVMKILAETVARFDIVAIQEIRDKTGNAIKDLEVAVDALGTDYHFIIGPRLGRTSSKEQYAFIYRSDSITALGSYTYPDSEDRFHREPFIGHFKVTGNPFDFVIINIHTDPDEATEEINALPAVIADARTHFSEQDVILVGDLNADGRYYDENDNSLPLRASTFTWLIGNDADTTVADSSNTYDRIITTLAANEDYTADTAKVFYFDQVFELDCEPKEVSDHYPVYAKFQAGNDTD